MKEKAKWLLAYFDDLISKNGGSGRSVQSWMYLVAGVGIIVSAVTMAMAAAVVAVYAALSPLVFAILSVPIPRWGWPGIKCTPAPLDTVFWGAYFVCLAGTWTAALNYISRAKMNSTNATKEITLAGLPQSPVPPTPTTTTTEVTVNKTVSGPSGKKKS